MVELHAGAEIWDSFQTNFSFNRKSIKNQILKSGREIQRTLGINPFHDQRSGADTKV